jgi:hypothetical protein
MEIEEYRPEPARPVPPEPPRKDRSAIVMSLIFVMTFLVTLAVVERHQLAEQLRQFAGSTAASKATQTSSAVSRAAPGITGTKIQGNVRRAMACIPANVLSAPEIEQLNAAIAALPANSLGTTTKALSADSFDSHKMTREQARETLQILVLVKGPLGDKALQALNQSISEGPCKIHPDSAASEGPTTPPPHAPSTAPATG